VKPKIDTPCGETKRARMRAWIRGCVTDAPAPSRKRKRPKAWHCHGCGQSGHDRRNCPNPQPPTKAATLHEPTTYVFFGETLTRTDLETISEVTWSAIQARMRNGMTLEEAVTLPRKAVGSGRLRMAEWPWQRTA